MISKIMTYKIRHSEYNQFVFWLREYIDKIRKSEPGTHAYYSFRYDEQEFIHFVMFKDKMAEDNHNAAPYTKLFLEQLKDSCDDEPEIKEAHFVNDPTKV